MLFTSIIPIFPALIRHMPMLYKFQPVLLYLCLCLYLFQMQCAAKSPVSNMTNPSGEQILKDLAKGKDVFIQNETINGDLDFTNLATAYRAAATAQQYEVTGSLTLLNCTVKGKVTGYLLSKEGIKTVVFRKNFSCPGTRFEAEVNLRDAQIWGIADFSGANFDKPASFEGAVFKSRCVFNKATFYDEARFQSATFEAAANFMDTGFEGICGFQNAVFFTDAVFNNVNFLRYADFGNLSVRGHAFFNYAKFGKQAVFGGSQFFGRAEWISATFENQADFSQTLFYGKTRLVKAAMKADVNFENTTFVLGKPDAQQASIADKTKLLLNGAKTASGSPLQISDF
ncbi:hypothetical protein C7N43_22130 [Sphingobacteriales bacterium UPWRP_1]|nr:hypothetical protein C7N43_22130 [Sphingobacteriales bacterium UPWRP_1]